MTILVLIKNSERYVFLFDDESRSDALRTLGRFASNPELSLNWYDCAKLSREIRNIDDRRSTIWVG